MADDFTPTLNLCKIEVGSSDGTWDEKMDENWDILDDSAENLSGKYLGVAESYIPPDGSFRGINSPDSWVAYIFDRSRDVEADAITLVPLASTPTLYNRFTVDQGCTFEWHVGFWGVSSTTSPATTPQMWFKTRLYNYTDAVIEADGFSDYARFDNIATANLHGESSGIAVLEPGKEYGIQYWETDDFQQGRLAVPVPGSSIRTSFGNRVHATMLFRRKTTNA